MLMFVLHFFWLNFLTSELANQSKDLDQSTIAIQQCITFQKYGGEPRRRFVPKEYDSNRFDW